jgi:hypothetical protein
MSNDVLQLADLVSSYQAYASADDLAVSAAVDAPATTPLCGGITAGIAFTVWTCNLAHQAGRNC